MTGAARGIGLATARHLAKRGHTVHAFVRASSDTTELEKLGANVIIAIADVTDADAIQVAVDQMERVDFVINNACHVFCGTSETCTIEEQQHEMDVNYFGPVRVLQAALPRMRQQRSGCVINISSLAGYEPFPYVEPYVASKFALQGLTESLATHLAPWNIRVAAVEPGGVKTEAPGGAPFGTRTVPDTDVYQKFCEAGRQRMRDGYASLMEPEAVAELIESILVDDAPSFHNPIGTYATEQAEARFRDSTGLSHIEAKRKLLKQMGLYDILSG